MTFTILFMEPENVTNPGQDRVQYSFPFSVIDSTLIGAPEQRSQTRNHRVIVGISRTRLAGWRLADEDLLRALFEFGKRHVASLAQSNALPSGYTIRCPLISTGSHPEPNCPFDPAAIPSPIDFTMMIEVAKPRIGF
jgi:hypothetical protein